MRFAGSERLMRSLVALIGDFSLALVIHALFDHVWWLEAIRSGPNLWVSFGLELLIFTFLMRFLLILLFGRSFGHWLAGLRARVGRLSLAALSTLDFLFFLTAPICLIALLLKSSSLSELIFGESIKCQLRPRLAQLSISRAPLILVAITMIYCFHGVISRQVDITRVSQVNDDPYVVNYQKSNAPKYSSNRFRVSFQSDLRDSLGVRRVSLIPSFEVVRSLGKKYFYPELVFFDRESKGFARLSVYKELDYTSFLRRSRSLDPSFSKRYPLLEKALGSGGKIESLAAGRDFQNYLMDLFHFDNAPIKGIFKAPLSSRASSFGLLDLMRQLAIGFSPKVSRMTLSNESFIRLQGMSDFGRPTEYWLSTKGPRLRVFELSIHSGEKKWQTEDILAILFKDAKWDWMADLAFPVGLLKEDVNAVSVVDLYTKSELGTSEKKVIEEFIFFHFFELAHDSLVFKQSELQTLIADTLERFLIIAKHTTGKGRDGVEQTLYSKRFQKNLIDLGASLASQDLNYFGIK